MKRLSIVPAVFFGVLMLSVSALAQTKFDFLTDSYLQSTFPMFRFQSERQTGGNDSPELVSTTLVISQIYGGAGCATLGCSTYKNDYIEIYNRGTTPVNVNGWSVQYASAAGTSWQVTPLTNFTIQPGKYYLISEGGNANGVNDLPTPDAAGTINMSATVGKVALVNSTTALSEACPTSANVIDFVGYGTTANCSEGGANAPAPSTVTSVLRKNAGQQDTDNNADDFTAAAPVPRNSASPGTQPNLSINDVSLSEGNAGTKTFTFTVNLSAPAGQGGVTFDIATADGTATVSDNDYITNSLTGQTIPQGNSSYEFKVTVNGDTTVEPDETFFVNVTNVTGANVADGQGQGTIVNDDAAQPGTVQFSSATYSQSESGPTATITVTRTGGSDGAVSVNYATVAGGTATGGASCAAGVDYVSTGGTLNWADGDSASKSFTVAICDDDVFETPDETVNLALSNPTGGATLGAQNTAVLTITENDTQPTVRFVFIGGSSGEGNGTVSIPVRRQGALGSAVSVDFAITDGTATGGAACTAGVDYIVTSGTLSWAAGDGTDKNINVTLCDDSELETAETFNLALSNPTGAVLGSPNAITWGINDNDATLQFTSATGTVGEGDGTITLTVTRQGANVPASVNYATASGTATGGASCVAGVDFINTSGTLNFAFAETSKTFNVTICDDAAVDPNEDFTVTLSSPSGAMLGTPSTQTVTITDNELDTTAPVITYTPISNDPAMTALTATVTDAVGVTSVTIFWSVNGGSFTSAPCTLSGGTPQNGTWDCVITGAPNPGAVAYYVTATDAAANTATNPSGGATAPNLFTLGSATIPAGTYSRMNTGNEVSLGGNVLVNNSLTLNGVVNAGANTLTIECYAIVTGGGENSYITGELEKRFCSLGTFTFNVGAALPLPPVSPEGKQLAPVSNYSPLTVNVTGVLFGSSLTVSVTDDFMTGAVQVNSISRYWTLTKDGILEADLTFAYRNEDVVGTETSYNVLRRFDGMIENYPGGTVDAANNIFSASGVTNFSQWSAGTAAPTAANAEISGRLVTASGEGIRNATVMLQGGTLSQPIYVQTGTFGSYRFTDLPVGETYLITVISKRYTFANPTRVINLTDSVTDENFIAEDR